MAPRCRERIGPVQPDGLLFLDEIQSVPEAISALRYFVKAGAGGALKSLHRFVADKGVSVAARFDAAPPSVQVVRTSVPRGGTRVNVTYRLLSLPLYLVERLPCVVSSLPADEAR